MLKYWHFIVGLERNGRLVIHIDLIFAFDCCTSWSSGKQWCRQRNDPFNASFVYFYTKELKKITVVIFPPNSKLQMSSMFWIKTNRWRQEESLQDHCNVFNGLAQHRRYKHKTAFQCHDIHQLTGELSKVRVQFCLVKVHPTLWNYLLFGAKKWKTL